MTKTTKYVSKKPDANGFVQYTIEENKTWEILYKRQFEIIQGRACDEYLEGLEYLKLSQNEIPQIPEVNKKLKAKTGWEVYPVAALIGFNTFFSLLADRKFPCATFIRTREELEYLQEPDIFHEIFGHCPMLTDKVYADFMQKYGELGVGAPKAVQKLLARLYWFTVEFGLINTEKGLKCYGGGILSSIGETTYSLEDSKPKRVPFDALEALRTPYRIDIMQPIYFIIDSFDDLYKSMDHKVLKLIDKALELGEHQPLYPLKLDENKLDDKEVPC